MSGMHDKGAPDGLVQPSADVSNRQPITGKHPLKFEK
jgi:hypothetical protein